MLTKMHTQQRLCVLFLLLGCCFQVLCVRLKEASNGSNYDNYQDDDYDYGDDIEVEVDTPEDFQYSNSKIANATETTTLNPPYFVQSELDIRAKPGDDVFLSCDVRNFRINNVVVWYRDKMIIATGQYANNNRYTVLKNYSIRINNVQSSDSGDYYCEIHPEKVRLHISLEIGSNLAIFCDGRDVTGRSIILREGGEHLLECQAYVPNKVDLKWSINGERAELTAAKVDTGKLYIENIDEEFNGIYQCLGDDNSENPPHGMVIISVQYKPKVSTHRHHINTEPGDNAELYCDYKANPIAIVQWLKQGQVLAFSEKYSIRSITYKKHNRTILTIKDVNEFDLGQFDCYVENTIGSNAIKIYLGYEPETPQFEEMDINGNVVKLYWLVRSKQSLVEAILDYKLTGSFTWSTVSVLRTQRHSEEGIWKITHEVELTPGEWHTRVKVKNTMGWSKFSALHSYTIKNNEELNNNSNVISPPDDLVLAAGIGLKKNIGASVSQRNSYECLITLSTIILWKLKCHLLW